MNTQSEAIQVGQRRGKIRYAMYVWLVLLLLLPLPATTARAAEPVIVVVGDGTPASCTNEALHQAIAAIPAGGTITFNCGPDPITIPIADIVLNKDVTIDGAGLVTFTVGVYPMCVFCIYGATVQFENFIITYAAAVDRGPIHNEGTLTMRHVTLSHSTAGHGNRGGGITNLGTLRIEDSLITDNWTGCEWNGYICSGGGGGGIVNDRILIIRNSIVSNNTAFGSGGGMINNGMAILENSTISGNRSSCYDVPYKGGSLRICGVGGGIVNGGSLSLINSTVSGNSTGSGGLGGNGGGIANYGNLFLQNATIANNTAQSAGGLSNDKSVNFQNSLVTNNLNISNQPSDCFGVLTSYGYNLIGNTTYCTITGDMTGNLLNVDPLLGPLQYNGSPTLTHILLPGSPAIDAGNPAVPGSGMGCQPADQRGVMRPQDGDGDGLPRCDIGAVEVEPSYLTVTLDIKPGDGENPINIKSKGVIPAAILSTDSFEAATVDIQAVQFGPGQAQPVSSGLEDVNGDGLLDVVMHFRTQQTGLQKSDTQACLTGQTETGMPIEGCDTIRIVP